MSRIDQLLSALLNGETVDITPQSRAEVYLKALMDGSGTEGLPAPQSRLDAYFYALVEKGIGGSGGDEPTDQTALAGAYTADGTFSNRVYTWDEMVENGINANWEEPQYIVDEFDNYIEAEGYDIVVPDTMPDVGAAYCNAIVYPKTTTYVKGGESLQKVYVKATTPPELDPFAFFEQTDVEIEEDDGMGGIYINIGTNTGFDGIVVPVGCGNAYKNADNWCLYAKYIAEGEMPI